MIFFVTLAGFIFVLRLLSRLVCHMMFWWDDFLNLLATVSLTLRRHRAWSYINARYLDQRCWILCCLLPGRLSRPRYRQLGSASRTNYTTSSGTVVYHFSLPLGLIEMLAIICLLYPLRLEPNNHSHVGLALLHPHLRC
jgi:hypothetical protein